MKKLVANLVKAGFATLAGYEIGSKIAESHKDNIRVQIEENQNKHAHSEIITM